MVSEAVTYDIHLIVPHEKQEKFIYSTAKRNIIRAGRRSGKTTGVSDMGAERFLLGCRVLYAAPTQEQVERFWFTVKQILREPIEEGVFHKDESRHVIELPNTEQRIKAKTAWNADTLRGDYADVLILDEFQMMKEDSWELVGLPMLADNDGTAFIIYTPPSIANISRSKARDAMYAAKLFQRAKADKSGRWNTFHFTSFDNPHVSKTALEELAVDMSAVAYRMEILAEDVSEAPGALWTRENIEKYRVSAVPELATIVVGVDPSATRTGDEAGIITAGVCGEDYYILGDDTLQGSPLSWASAAVSAFSKYQADNITAEGNQGGEMVSQVISQVNKNVPVRMVTATRGKAVRASPVATLSERGKLHFVGSFPKLEDELCLWIPGAASPNRLDAMVWAVTALMGKANVSDDEIERFGRGESVSMPESMGTLSDEMKEYMKRSGVKFDTDN